MPSAGAVQIGGQTKLMGVIGDDIAYTLSPAMHNRAAAMLGIDAAYLPLSMPKSEVRNFLRVAWRLGAVGFNVTTPHKELVATLCKGHRLKSVNTVYRGKTGWLATSTDAAGFAAGLARIDRDLSSFEKIVLLGSGGVTLAILAHLAGMPSSGAEVVALRRKRARDSALKTAARGLALRVESLTPARLARELKGRGSETLLIQATSAPHKGDDLKALVPALDGYKGVVADLVYGRPSALYFAAIAKDLVAQDGEAMLIEQARFAQQLWWGKAAPYDVMAQALRGK